MLLNNCYLGEFRDTVDIFTNYVTAISCKCDLASVPKWRVDIFWYGAVWKGTKSTHPFCFQNLETARVCSLVISYFGNVDFIYPLIKWHKTVIFLDVKDFYVSNLTEYRIFIKHNDTIEVLMNQKKHITVKQRMRVFLIISRWKYLPNERALLQIYRVVPKGERGHYLVLI